MVLLLFQFRGVNGRMPRKEIKDLAARSMYVRSNYNCDNLDTAQDCLLPLTILLRVTYLFEALAAGSFSKSRF